MGRRQTGRKKRTARQHTAIGLATPRALSLGPAGRRTARVRAHVRTSGGLVRPPGSRQQTTRPAGLGPSGASRQAAPRTSVVSLTCGSTASRAFRTMGPAPPPWRKALQPLLGPSQVKEMLPSSPILGDFLSSIRPPSVSFLGEWLYRFFGLCSNISNISSTNFN